MKVGSLPKNFYQFNSSIFSLDTNKMGLKKDLKVIVKYEDFETVIGTVDKDNLLEENKKYDIPTEVIMQVQKLLSNLVKDKSKILVSYLKEKSS